MQSTIMSVQISIIKKNKLNNTVIFFNKGISFSNIENIIGKKIFKNLKDFINKKENFTKREKIFHIYAHSFEKVIFINTDNVSKENSFLEYEKIGANLYDYLKKNHISSIKFLEENAEIFLKYNKYFLNQILYGINLKSYNFTKYKTQKKDVKINIYFSKKLKDIFLNNNKKFNALLEGINLTKNLVSEPGNILHPDEYVKRIKSLKKLGLKVTVYNKDKLKKLGMNALLGVGQGSVRGSYLVSIEWKGSKKQDSPLAFVGKGVCFDTGGISLKPAKFMEDMTYDMAGSAVVIGLMKSLALRKAKINAVGVVGLVENMPDGNAQRPGDIVKSYSGKTIEILNTDAEGRLVLADALTYTEKKYKPKFIVDLATLTGAIIVSLGSEYAGLFSNDDKISNQLSKAGEKVGEKVWRMPLNDNYDKLINSKKADVQNINYVGGAGSTTAAQFLQRFILNKTPWAHLDIAGMAFSKYGGALNSGGATGYGVRLLNQLIEDNYE
jgi:leucyl aminopeptidase